MMGAYGTPEHLPGENQEPQDQYSCSKIKKRGILHGDLKTWQKAILIIYLCIVGFFEFAMLVGLGNYTGYMPIGIFSAIAFFVLAAFFAVRINAHKKAWPLIICSLIAFVTYFCELGSSATKGVTAVPTASSESFSSNAAVLSSASGSASSSKSVSSQKKASGKTSSHAKQTTESQKLVDAATQYKSECQSFKYKSVARKPNDYKSKKAKFTGQVSQIEENWGSDVILLSVTKGEYDTWSDNIYVEYTPKSKDESRILENDIITVYGELNGIKTYTTVLGNSVSIPYFTAQYVDISSESK